MCWATDILVHPLSLSVYLYITYECTLQWYTPLWKVTYLAIDIWKKKKKKKQVKICEKHWLERGQLRWIDKHCKQVMLIDRQLVSFACCTSSPCKNIVLITLRYLLKSTWPSLNICHQCFNIKDKNVNKKIPHTNQIFFCSFLKNYFWQVSSDKKLKKNQSETKQIFPNCYWERERENW